MHNYLFIIAGKFGPFTSGVGLFPTNRHGYCKSEIFKLDFCFLHVFVYSKNK